MQKKRSVILVLVVVPLLLCMSFAQEEHPSQMKDFLGKLINFILLFGGLTYLLRKPLGKFFQQRSQSLEKSLREAKQSHEESSTRLNEVEARMERLGEEIAAMQKEAEASGKSLRGEVLEEARHAADRLKHLANQEIEMLTQSAVREIKHYTVTLAANLARQSIQDRLTEESHSSLIDKSIERLEKLHEKSNSDTQIC